MKLFLEHKCFEVSLICDILTLVRFDGSKAEMNILPIFWQVFAISQLH